MDASIIVEFVGTGGAILVAIIASFKQVTRTTSLEFKKEFKKIREENKAASADFFNRLGIIETQIMQSNFDGQLRDVKLDQIVDRLEDIEVLAPRHIP